MKILSLKIKNINSLKGEHFIDFSTNPLADAGLFAIVGPTGSGKSTILDAITLALYDRIPRVSADMNKNVIEQQGLIMTHHTSDSFSEVVFEVKEKQYRSSWTIAVNRNGNLNDRKMELADAITGEIIASSLSEVKQKNVDTIGLNYDQFVQSMILAQGQFAKLLHANKKDRNKLLEEITGGKLYREIGKAAFKKSKAALEDLKELNIRLGEVRLMPAEELDLKQQFVSINEPKKKKLEEQLEEIKSKVTVKESIQKTKKNIELVQEKEKTINQKLKDLAPKQQQLDQHLKYVKYNDDIKKLIDSIDNKEKIISKIITSKKQFDTEQTAKQHVVFDAKKLLNQKLKEEDLLTELNSFRIKVSELLEKENESKTIALNKHDELKEKVKEINENGFEFQSSENRLLEAQNEIASINEKLAAAKIQNKEEIPSKKQDLSNKKDWTVALINEAKNYQEKENQLKAKEKSNQEQLQEITKNIKELEEKTKDKKEKEGLFQTKELELKKIETEKSLEIHKSNLKDGEPCPLCGALEHPHAEKHFENKFYENLKASVNELKKSVETLSFAINKTDNLITILEKQTKKEGEEIEKEKQLIAERWKKIEILCEKLNFEKKIELEKWQQQKQNYDKSIKLLEDLEKAFSLKSSLEKLIIVQEKYNELKLNFEKIRDERKAIYEGKDIADEVGKLKSNFEKCETNILNFKKQHEDLEKALKSNEQEVENLETKLNQVAKENQLNAWQEIKAFILSEEKAEEIRKELKSINDKLAETKGSLDQLNKDLQEQISKDDATKDIETLKEFLTNKKTEFDELNEKIIKFRTEIESENELKKRFEKLQAEKENLEKEYNRWKTLNDLIGDSNGDKFSAFVQDLTLTQLIHFANLRLKGLSDRYLIASPSEDDKSDTLRIVDTHLGDIQRAVTSLSGGETFKISLAMALGLSDLAAKNVSIDSIFIDEGFGTLDPEALEEAINVLEDMQSTTNKSVGIISHVSELKERISTKINLIPTGNGYSTISIN